MAAILWGAAAFTVPYSLVVNSNTAWLSEEEIVIIITVAFILVLWRCHKPHSSARRGVLLLLAALVIISDFERMATAQYWGEWGTVAWLAIAAAIVIMDNQLIVGASTEVRLLALLAGAYGISQLLPPIEAGTLVLVVALPWGIRMAVDPNGLFGYGARTAWGIAAGGLVVYGFFICFAPNRATTVVALVCLATGKFAMSVGYAIHMLDLMPAEQELRRQSRRIPLPEEDVTCKKCGCNTPSVALTCGKCGYAF